MSWATTSLTHSAKRCSLPSSACLPKAAPCSSRWAVTNRKRRVVPLAKAFEEMGFQIYATEHTGEVLKASGISDVTILHKVKEATPKHTRLPQRPENRLGHKRANGNKAANLLRHALTDGYEIRRKAVEFNVPVITNLELASSS